MSLTTKQHWLPGSCSAFLAVLLFSLTLSPGSISSAAYSVVNQAPFVTLICYLLLPRAKNLVGFLINSSVATALFMLITQLPGAADIPVTILLQLCVVIFALSMLLWSLTQLFEFLFPDKHNSRSRIILLTVMVAASPLWLGPAADIYALDNTIINGIISITPLTHFSVAAEYDYLRSDWFYQNSAFGSLPFGYPEFNTIAMYYFLFVCGLQIILWRLTHVLKSGRRPDKNTL